MIPHTHAWSKWEDEDRYVWKCMVMDCPEIVTFNKEKRPPTFRP